MLGSYRLGLGLGLCILSSRRYYLDTVNLLADKIEREGHELNGFFFAYQFSFNVCDQLMLEATSKMKVHHSLYCLENPCSAPFPER